MNENERLERSIKVNNDNILFLIQANQVLPFSSPYNFLSLLQYHLKQIDELQDKCTGDKSEREIRLRVASTRELVKQITHAILSDDSKR